MSRVRRRIFLFFVLFPGNLHSRESNCHHRPNGGNWKRWFLSFLLFFPDLPFSGAKILFADRCFQFSHFLSLSSHSPFRCIKKLTFERMILNHFSYFSATTTQSNNFPFGRPNTTDAADLIWSPIFHWNRNLLAISFTLYQPKRSASHHLRVCERGRRSWLNFPAQLTVKQCRVVLFSISFCSPF